MEQKDDKYLNFPIPMLKELPNDSKKFFDDAFDIGVYQYSKTLTGSDEKRYTDSLKFFNITQVNLKNRISNAKSILQRMPEKYPFVGIEKEMLFDFYKNYKTEFEIICLSAFLGIKSILGKKPYDKTNKDMVRARMFGYNSPKDLPSKLTALQKKYDARRQFDKVLNELQINWHLKILSNHNRGFYLSFDLSLDQLAEIIEKSKQQTKIQQLNEAKKKAIEKAKLKILYT